MLRYRILIIYEVPTFFTAYHNMDIYSQVKHRLQAPILARKCDVSHWFPCVADGRRDGSHMTTKVYWIDR